MLPNTPGPRETRWGNSLPCNWSELFGNSLRLWERNAESSSQLIPVVNTRQDEAAGLVL